MLYGRVDIHSGGLCSIVELDGWWGFGGHTGLIGRGRKLDGTTWFTKTIGEDLGSEDKN